MAPILDAKCRSCHGDPPKNGAPFSLEGYEPLLHPVDPHPEPLYERMLAAVDSHYMPPVWMSQIQVEDLTDSERTRLLAWLAAGAPRGVGSCE